MVGAIFMAAIASRISVTWSSFNVTTGDKPGLSGGVVVGARAIGGWHCTISVIAIAKRGEGSERCLRSWVLGNTEGNGQDFRGDPCPYIFIGFVSLSVTEVHSRAANAGRLIKEADSILLWMN
jgi:hypothetical protein